MYDGKVVFKVDLNTKDFTKQMENTKNELGDLIQEYEEMSEKFGDLDNADTKYTRQELTRLSAKIEETANKYVDLKKKQDAVLNNKKANSLASIKNIESAYVKTDKKFSLQKGSYSKQTFGVSEVKGELPYISKDLEDLSKGIEDVGKQEDNTSKKSKTFGETMNKSFKKGLKSVTKLALGIIGIRGAYMLARRAASAYMSQDEELSKKMQQTWVGLGAFLEPVLTKLTDLMLKFVGYLNEFIKALTGKDYIARANAKALEKQAKAQEKLNKETEKYQNYDFDVIRTQQSKKLKDEDEANTIDIPELNEKIVKKLQDLAKWLKENKELIEAVGIALGITFGAVAIGKLVANIGALLGSATLSTGLLGLAAVLAIIAGAYVISVVIKGQKEIDDMYNKVHELNEFNKEKRQELINTVEEEMPDESEEAQNRRKLFQAQDWESDIDRINEDIERLKIQKETGFLGDLLHVTKGDNQLLKDNIDALSQNYNELINIAKAGKLTKSGYKKLIYFVDNLTDNIDELNQISKDYNINEKELFELIEQYGNVFPELYDEQTKYRVNLYKTRDAVIDLDLKLAEGKITVQEYNKELAKIRPSVTTEFKANITTAHENAMLLKKDISSIPDNKTTKVNVDTTQATQKLFSLKDSVLNWLPNKKTVTVEVKGDASKLATVLDTIASAMEIIQPGPVGYAMSSNLRYQANMLKNYSAFATGGYVSQPTMALIGEAGYGEYVVPERDDYISRLASLINEHGNGGVTNIYLDGRLIQRQVDNTRNRINFTKNR